MLAAVLLLAGAVMLLLKGEQPDRYIETAVWLTVMLGAALAGWLGAKIEAEKPWLSGLMSGLLYTAILCVLTLPFGDGFTPTGLLLRGVLPVVLSTGVGCLMGRQGITRYGNRRKAAKHAGKTYKGKR